MNLSIIPLVAAVLMVPMQEATESDETARWRTLSERYAQLHAETGNSSLLLLLAESRARAGEAEGAVAALEELLALQTGLVVTNEPGLLALRGLPDIDGVIARLDIGAPQIGQARIAAEISLPGLIPEGIAASGDRLYVGDMAGRQILTLVLGESARVFASTGELRPLGMTVERGRNRLWVAATTAFVAGETPESAILGFDLATGELREKFSSPELRSVNDLAVAFDGSIYITDSLGGALFRLRPERAMFERITPASQMSYPNGVAVSADGRAVYVAQGVTLKRVDVESGFVETVAQPRSLALLSVDGLYSHGPDLIAVQNGGSSGRLLRLRLSTDGKAIIGFDVLAARLPEFDMPTTAAITDNRLYLIANSQLRRLLDDGQIENPQTLRPIQILEIDHGGSNGSAE